MCLSIEWKSYTSEFRPGTVEKNSSSTIGPPAGIEPTVRRSTALTTKNFYVELNATKS